MLLFFNKKTRVTRLKTRGPNYKLNQSFIKIKIQTEKHYTVQFMFVCFRT